MQNLAFANIFDQLDLSDPADLFVAIIDARRWPDVGVLSPHGRALF
jgi:hypothetical protein